MPTNTPNYSINPEDERFTQVDEAKQQAMTELEQTYGGMIGESDKFYQAQIDASKQWADTQSQLQQEQTDFTIEQIEQEKDQAQKDYLKEQSGAYVDWQKQSNQYGVAAEQQASAGLAGSGFSESSQVAMYNQYQNRVAVAKESVNKAILNYNNKMTEARLQNNSIQAEIAFNSLKEQLSLSLEGFQYKNQLILDQANKKVELENTYWARYQDVLAQINQENALAEDVRQFNENQLWQTEQAELDREFQASQNELEREFKATENLLDRQHQLKVTDINNKFEAAQAQLNRQHDKDMFAAKTKHEKDMLERQHKKDLEKLKKQHEYDLAQADKQLENEKKLASYRASVSKSSSGGSSSGGGATITKPSAVTGNGTINQTSVMKLGYGPITPQYLAQLVAEGKVVATERNGEIYVERKESSTPKLPDLSSVSPLLKYQTLRK